MLTSILSVLFGSDNAIPAVSYYEVKQYAGTALQNTWTASVVHETQNGFAFIDLATGSPVTVSGTVKITGVLPVAQVAAVTPATTA
jgi:hypothetical protein